MPDYQFAAIILDVLAEHSRMVVHGQSELYLAPVVQWTAAVRRFALRFTAGAE